ncbi:MAG TPA: MarR family transcriptional regulator [Candidatus Limnocylindria bacterium]
MKGDGSVLYDVYVLGQAVNEMLADGLADAPLTPQEYAVYSAIFERGPATPSELSHALGMPAQTMSDWIGMLRERGHAEARRNPRDGRSQLVSLSPSGRRAHRRTNRSFELVYRRFLDELALPEDTARRLLAEMVVAARVVRGEGVRRADPTER